MSLFCFLLICLVLCQYNMNLSSCSDDLTVALDWIQASLLGPLSPLLKIFLMVIFSRPKPTMQSQIILRQSSDILRKFPHCKPSVTCDLLFSWLELHHNLVFVLGLHLLYEGGGHLLLLLSVVVDAAPVLSPAVITLPDKIKRWHPSDNLFSSLTCSGWSGPFCQTAQSAAPCNSPRRGWTASARPRCDLSQHKVRSGSCKIIAGLTSLAGAHVIVCGVLLAASRVSNLDKEQLKIWVFQQRGSFSP